jgi:NAD(P)-dependent dehydrogenase (short-subunit alcohol dehydrogenase family)
VTRRVKEQFVPLIKEIPGLVAYYLINTEQGTIISVSVFETPEGQEESKRVLPVGRVGEPEDLAETYLYLMRERFSTGAMIVVDGGSTLV